MTAPPSPFPRLGLGVGLRREHYAYVLRERPPVDWLEIIAENFLGLSTSGAGGRPLRILTEARALYPLAVHGVSLSLGSVDPLDEAYIDRLSTLVRHVDPVWVSDHLCWAGVGGESLHDLLPLPFTEEALEHVSARLERVQTRLGRRLLIENVSSYVTFAHSEMTEAEFLAELSRRTGCGLLLDLNNVFVSAVNHGFEPARYLAALPAQAVAQFHLAGFSEKCGLLIDTHDARVSEPVWELYRRAVERFGAVSTCVEWDDNLPAFSVLLEELCRARAIAGEASLVSRPCEASASPPGPRSSKEGGGPALADLQGWMRRVITEPRGVEVALAEIGPASVIEASEGLSVVARLSIYAEAYFWRLADALAETFPAVREVLGGDAFLKLCSHYLERYPSRVPSLSEVGETLCDFLSESPPRALPCLVDLARLEWAVNESFFAWDAPPDPVASPEFANTLVRLDPSVRLVEVRFRVEALWAGRNDEAGLGRRAAELEEDPGALLVFRDNEVPRVERITFSEKNLLMNAREGVRLGEVASRLEKGDLDSVEVEALGRAFGRRLREGVLRFAAEAH